MADLEVVRTRRTDQLIELLEPHEPYSTLLVANLLERGDTRDVRTWTVEAGGEPKAVLLVGRASPVRWYAAPFLWEPSDEVIRAVAGLIDASLAWNVTGPAPHLAPLYDHLRRRQYAIDIPFMHRAAPLENLQEPDPASRVATPDDLDEVVALYEGFEHIGFVVTVRWLRQMFRDLIERGRVVVTEEDGRLAGALYMDRASRHYACWNGLTVLPEFRGRGLGWRLMARGGQVTIDMGLGYMGAVNPTNPMRLKSREQMGDSEDRWIWARLQPPHRFPGHWRLRNLWVALHGPRLRPRTHTGAERDDVGWVEGESARTPIRRRDDR